MAKHIDKKDLDNDELTTLPVRRGCSGICACIGSCKTIIGYVERKDYDDFLKHQITLDTFLSIKSLQNPPKK